MAILVIKETTPLIDLPLPLGVLYIDRKSQRILQRNAFMASHYPYTFLEGIPLSSYIHPEDLPQLHTTIQQFSGKYDSPLSLRFMDNERKWHWGQWRLGCMDLQSNAEVLFLCFIECPPSDGFAFTKSQAPNPFIESPIALTRREEEVLKLIAAGKRDKEIASELYLSSYTIMNHRRKLLRKLNAKNKVDLVRISKEKGLL